MAKPYDSGKDPNDILDLIAEVHADTPKEQDTLDRALGTLESTHRRASAAMQRFERTGRTTAYSAQTPAGSLSFGPAGHTGAEPPGRRAEQASSTNTGLLPASTEVTQTGPMPTGPSTPRALPASEERTQTAIAAPKRPIPVAEVLSGRGAEFADRGHTKTHIVHTKKNLPKK